MGLAPGSKAIVISVGNELLIGKVVNTNFSWLGSKLTELGFRVDRGIVVPDDLEVISWAFRTAVDAGAKVVIATGGLGPTFDDMTSEGLARAMGVEMELNDDALEMIRRKYGGELTESRTKMAKMPRGAKPIANPVGTAPGVEVEWRGSMFFLLPGVPSEMMAMFEENIKPKLIQRVRTLKRAESLLRSIGLPESLAAPVVENAAKIGEYTYVKSHPKGSETGKPILELHVTAYGVSEEEALNKLEEVINYLFRELSSRGAQVYRIG
ncbi:MAG: nicotinamide mononucleotide deamidase-related protein [Thermofilaceae archaeon]